MPTQSEQLRYGHALENGMWLSVLEKAFAQYRATLEGNVLHALFHPTSWLSEDAYKFLKTMGSGLTGAIHLLTGRARENMIVNPASIFQTKVNAKALVAHLMKVIDNDAAGDVKPLTVLALAGTPPEAFLGKSFYNDPKWKWSGHPNELTPGHAYAIVGYNPTTNRVVLQNPHNLAGTYGRRFDMSVDDFCKAYVLVAFEK